MGDFLFSVVTDVLAQNHGSVELMFDESGKVEMGKFFEHLLLQASEQLSQSQLTTALVEAPAAIRIAAFFAVWIGLWLPIAISLSFLLKWHPPQPLTATQKLPLVLSLYALAPILLITAAHIQRVPFTSYGWLVNGTFIQSIVLGLGVGIGGVAILIGLEQRLGWLIWQSAAWHNVATAFLTALVIGLLVSGVEELVFRGFLLNQLQQDYGIWMGAIATSIIFALLHLVWDGWRAAPQLPGLWLMGMVLVLARWVDHGSLGLACGLHAGWIGGMAGLDLAQLTRQTGRGAAWLMGYTGSPLAGIMGLLLLLLTGVGVWALAIG